MNAYFINNRLNRWQRFSVLLAAATLCLALVTSLASAVPIANLHNTGLDSASNYLPTGGSDAHYSVISSPFGPFTPIAVDDTTFPLPPWVANNPTASRWIGTSFQSSNGPAGTYVYRTSFNLPANADLSSVLITALWASDDPASVNVNTIPSGQFSAGHTVLVPLSLTNNFQVGNNDIDFVVINAGGPTGLRVDGIAGSYNLIPEPASCMLAFIGLGGLFMRRSV